MALGVGPGGTSVPSQITQYYDALLTTTLESYRPTLVDNIFKDSAFLTALRMSDAWVSKDGGVNISIPLMYGNNSTIKSYRGYDVIDTTPWKNLGAFKILFYCWNLLKPNLLLGNDERDHNGQSATNSNIASLACWCMGIRRAFLC